uniref:Ig-like domain-containing protein n=1 Tax=Gopherus evgoodei TaxID=1825980 RepID=A0A8C4Y7D0_9SAUR
MLRLLILALLWRGSLSQLPRFTLTVLQSVYRYKDPATVGQNPPMASNDPSWGVSQETKGRFQLVENLVHGDCSLQISDAQWTDTGRYFLRIEKGSLKYSYLSRLMEEPEIQISPAWGLPGMLLAGEPVTVTCTAPGRCSGPPPQVTWTGPFNDTARDISALLANGTWAHSSALSFTPGPGDHGKELVCTVTRGHHGDLPPAEPSGSMSAVSDPPQCLHAGPQPPLLGSSPLGSPTQEGDSLSLRCEAGSRPEATLSWARMNGSLSSGQGGAGRLELPNLRIGDAGEYRCWAKNSCGSASWALRVHMQRKALGGAVQREGPQWWALCSKGWVADP